MQTIICIATNHLSFPTADSVHCTIDIITSGLGLEKKKQKKTHKTTPNCKFPIQVQRL